MKRKVRAGQLSIQQAAPDALCGIYSLLNFLNRHVRLKLKTYDDIDENGKQYTTHGEENERKIFRELIHAAEDTGHLCAETICNGFGRDRLKATYDRFLTRNSFSGELRIHENALSRDIFEFSEEYFRDCNRGEARGIGILTEDESHWMLIAGSSERGLLIFDSSGNKHSYHLTRRMNGSRKHAKQNLNPEILLLMSVQTG